MIIDVDRYEDIREFASYISNVPRTLAESTRQQLILCEKYSRELGTHYTSLYDSLLVISNVLSPLSDSIIELSEKLNVLADKYENLYLNDPFLNSGGMPSTMARGMGSIGNQNSLKDTDLVAGGYCGSSDFGRLDQRVVDDITERVVVTKQIFPALNIQFVGSMQARNIKVEKYYRNMLNNMRGSYEYYHPGVTDEEIDRLIEADVKSLMEDITPSVGTIAQAIGPNPTDNALKNKGLEPFLGISVSEKYGDDYDKFILVSRKDVENGYHPENCYSPKATVDHELGHQLDYLTGARADNQIKIWFQSFQRLSTVERAKVLSIYAGEKNLIGEFIAESWAEYCNNPKCRVMAKQVAERVIELYKARYGGLGGGGNIL